MTAESDPPRHDFRMPALGAAAWVAGIAATVLASSAVWLLLALVLAIAAALALRSRLVTAALMLGAAVVASTVLRHTSVAASPLRAWAEDRATADLVATVVSDPRRVEGQWGDQVVVRLRVEEVTARGVRQRLGGTVVVLGAPAWAEVALGEQVLAEGRLAPSDRPEEAAVLTGARSPVRIRGPDVWWRASATLRTSIREAVAHRPPDQAGLVPALVDGDDASLPATVEEDFRTTGLTHLTAVSGTNLTLVVGALLLAARTVGVRRRWLVLVGLIGIVGFILLARTEPSVLRAAAMGTVGLFAFGADGRRRGLRALGVAVTALVLVQPTLAVAAGFALSVLATAGIVLLGPPLSAALGRWLPTGVAEAIAVPTAAQLACTPVIAVLSGQVSLVAIIANLLAGPLVGPATVLGLLGGLVGLVAPVIGRVLGTGAGWCVGWIIAVARHGAALPGATIGWGTSVVAIALLVVLCVVVGVLLPSVLRRRSFGAALGVGLLLVVLGVPGRIWSAPGFGWPPAGWVLVACDVGQGDGLVLATGPGTALVIDAGPDPDAMDGCLDRLDIDRIPLVVLTHFHADHVDGLEGVLRGRRVTTIEVTPAWDPPAAVDQVNRVAGSARVPVSVAPFGVARRYGAAVVQVLHPDIPVPVPGAGDGSSANDASVVLLVEVDGVRLLLTGDVEPPGQAALARLVPDLDVDVLKVPHHGSAHQDFGWLQSLAPEFALVSVGVDNDYGHPAPKVVDALEGAGAEVLRTDTSGDLAIVVGADGAITTDTRR
ncbi:MAG: ComEC/Rec2 family competence protein [Propionibacteriales bacterium]|nr:ComEC/Rec2 family competence protein [Propionibacteriales bacterium]